MLKRRSTSLCALLLWAALGCSNLPKADAPTRGGGGSAASGRCQTVGGSQNPLVTEWSASDKAHLQSLTASQPVAVKFAGCNLEIIPACALPGRYTWQRTTLATDTLEIEDKNELYSKLPIGAVSLEATLEKAGKLSVKSTVAGQLTLLGTDLDQLALGPGCAEATHVVTRVSVGAFKMFSGSDLTGKGGVTTAAVGASAGTTRRESLLREAGDPNACGQASDEAPSNQCAAPIQLFLAPLRPEQEARVVQSGAVQIAIPKPDDWEESWTLRDQTGNLICRLPCTQWVNPGSGYYLMREAAPDIQPAKIRLPNSFPYPPGSQLEASYQIEKGSPFWSTLTLYGVGIPATVFAGYALGMGISGVVADPCAADDPGCGRSRSPATYFGWSAVALGVASATLWWNLYSQEERFETYGSGSQVEVAERPSRHQLGLGYYKLSF